MSKVVYKYPFVTDAMNAPMGTVLLVAQQSDSTIPTVWIEHDQNAPRSEGFYWIRATGQPFTSTIAEEHVGSAICGDFVWHVYRSSTKQ